MTSILNVSWILTKLYLSTSTKQSWYSCCIFPHRFPHQEVWSYLSEDLCEKKKLKNFVLLMFRLRLAAIFFRCDCGREYIEYSKSTPKFAQFFQAKSVLLSWFKIINPADQELTHQKFSHHQEKIRLILLISSSFYFQPRRCLYMPTEKATFDVSGNVSRSWLPEILLKNHKINSLKTEKQ